RRRRGNRPRRGPGRSARDASAAVSAATFCRDPPPSFRARSVARPQEVLRPAAADFARARPARPAAVLGAFAGVLAALAGPFAMALRAPARADCVLARAFVAFVAFTAFAADRRAGAFAAPPIIDCTAS